ncbi:protein LOL2 isoform X2 [Malania oleifera]|uniref:protein LOL2 isoform X2 n=1 Tax=Malania oleifera TaxID=397392 RepID=UPI0025AE4CCC|nr:protein LOL2 isoform X2 [Malania oleifera]
MGSKEPRGGGEEEDEEEGPPPGWSSIPPPQPHSEMAQMVCGSCHHLLAYPQGAKHVQCSCCHTVNVVLEAHQVGQVKCGGCAVLLMYPYGAPSVRCSSCHFATEIGVHNKRPPLSVQQAQATAAPYSLQ